MNTAVTGAILLLASGGAFAAGTADSGETRVCQGPYPVLLMTAGECRAYVRQMRFLETQGQAAKLAEWKRQHDRLLEERARACPCASDPRSQDPVLVVAGDC